MFFNNNNARDMWGSGNRGQNRPDFDDVIVNPAETVVNTRTNKRVVKNIHPTEVINVNRTIIKNKHFFPVSERDVNETIVEDYDCGSDINRPRCVRRENANHCGCNHHCNCRNR